MAVKPLAVAIGAMALLVASVGFEIAFHRTYAIDVQGETGWQTIGVSSDGSSARPYALEPGATSGSGPIVAERNDTLTFRLRVDNGYPWSLSEPYDVRFNGVIVAEGTIEAAARGEGESTFTIPASTLFGPELRDPPASPSTYYPGLELLVGSTSLYASFQLQEAS